MGDWGKVLRDTAIGLADRLRLLGVGDLREVDRLGCTQLHVASENGNAARVELLLKAEGASVVVNARDERGSTALHRASGFGHNRVVVVLLGAEGIDISLADGEGRTALHIASGHGKTEVVDLLLAGGVDVNCADLRGRTALHYASLNGHAGAVELLLGRSEIDVNCADAKGLTPLHWACRMGERGLDVATLLLGDMRVRTRAKTLEGTTPEDEAKRPLTDGFGTFYVEGELHRRRALFDKRIASVFRETTRRRTALALWALAHTHLAPKAVHVRVALLCD